MSEKMNDETLSALLEGLKKMDPKNSEHYTGQGLPRVEVLEAMAGVADISSAMRDQAFMVYSQTMAPAVENLSPDNVSKESHDAASKALLEEEEKEAEYWVEVYPGDDEKGDVELAVNGKNVLIQRGVRVKLKERYVEVLRNAVVRTFTKDPETGKESPVSIPRFAYSVEKI